MMDGPMHTRNENADSISAASGAERTRPPADSISAASGAERTRPPAAASAASAAAPPPGQQIDLPLQRALSPLPPSVYGDEYPAGTSSSSTTAAACTRIRFLPRELPEGVCSPSAVSAATMDTHVLDVESPSATLERKKQGGGIVYFPPENLAEYLDSSLVTPVSGGASSPQQQQCGGSSRRKHRTFFDECAAPDEEVLPEPSAGRGPKTHTRTGMPSPKVARFYCAYCMRNRPGTSRRRFEGNGGCSHEFCKACLEDYLFQRIMVGHHSLHPCPKFGEESCRSSATRNDVRRIVRAEVYEEHRRRLEGLSGACEECGHRGRRPSIPSSPYALQPPSLPSPSSPSPRLSSPSRRASAAAASHEADADAGANEDKTCQSCGSMRRRHHHHHHHHNHHNHHHQSHRLKRHVPRDAAAAGAAGTAAGWGVGRKGRKGFAWSPRWSPHGRAAALDGTASGAEDERRQRRNKQPDERQQQQRQQRRELSPEAAAASGADPPEIDEKSATGGKEGGEQTEAASAAGTHAVGLRHRTCPMCGAHGSQSPRGSRRRGGNALVDPDDVGMTSTAAASETTTARLSRGPDMTDNLVACLGCGGAWCQVCGGPVSTAETTGGGVSSGGDSGGGYRRTSTDANEGRGCDGQGESVRGSGYAISTGGAVPREHVRHFSRWNVTGCPGARYTDPKGWEGEFITLYRALVAVIVLLVGPLFFFLHGVCLLVETLLAPLCCGAFGGASRSVPDIVCFPLAVTLSVALTAAWLPLGLVAAAARLLWTAATFGRPQADEDGDSGSGGGQLDSGVPALGQPDNSPASRKKRQTTGEGKACRTLAFASAVMLSSYLASWWREGGDGGRGRGRGRGTRDGGIDETDNKQWQKEDLPDGRSEKARELLVVAAEEGGRKGKLETPPLSVSPARI